MPDPSLFATSRSLTIEWGQCDPAGIVFFPRYFEMFDVSTAALLSAALGGSMAEIIVRHGILGWPMVASEAEYLAPCSFGDAIVIHSEISRIGRSSFGVHHRLMRGDVLAVDAREARVWTARRSARADDIGAVPIPEAVVGQLSTPAPSTPSSPKDPS